MNKARRRRWPLINFGKRVRKICQALRSEDYLTSSFLPALPFVNPRPVHHPPDHHHQTPLPLPLPPAMHRYAMSLGQCCHHSSLLPHHHHHHHHLTIALAPSPNSSLQQDLNNSIVPPNPCVYISCLALPTSANKRCVKYAFPPVEYKTLFVCHNKSQQQSAQTLVPTVALFCAKLPDIRQDRRLRLAGPILKWSAKSALFLTRSAPTFVLDHAHEAAYRSFRLSSCIYCPISQY